MLILVGCLNCLIGYGQVSESDSLAYRAYVSSADAQMGIERWKKAIRTWELQLSKDPDDLSVRYKLALAQFGLLSTTMRNRDEDLFDAYVAATEENLKVLIGKNKRWAEPHALLASLYGLELAYDPWKGMFLGPKSSSLMMKALALKDSSPLVHKLYGNSKFFAPADYGGDVNEAIAAYETSVKLSEKAGRTDNNWFYLDTMAFLGQAYAKKGNRERAMAYYEKALAIEPEFGWVKYVLLPSARNGERHD